LSARADFWSRRKAAVAEEARAGAEAERLARTAEERKALEDRPDEDVLAELNLPDPDSMKQGDEFSAFMAEAVPERLRRRALRRPWPSDPQLANSAHLVDYGEDDPDAARAVENRRTASRVGKGMLKHLEALAEAAERAAGPDSAEAEREEAAAGEAETDMAQAEEPAAASAVIGPASDTGGAPLPAPAEPAMARAKPRMRFAFGEAEPGQAA